jgi:hypothetical protein
MPDLTLRTLLDETLRLPASAIPYRLGGALAAALPSKAILETEDGDFDVWRFRHDGKCAIEWHEEVHCQRTIEWHRDAPHLTEHPHNVWMRVRWGDASVDVVRIGWQEGFNGNRSRCFVVADSRDLAERFFAAVCAHCHVPHHEILVFNGSCWSRSHAMYASVAQTGFEDIVLAGALKDEIRGDLERFLAARDDYARYRVPWRRGILFLGPPGNGKTHCLRACIRLLDVPCLYVQSVASKYETEDANVRRVFERARELTPCCLVLEDLDALITEKNRSFFLNQLDGFEQNDGLLVIATTNHPERLDPAILDRPSRFDRKYHFELPARPERAAYVDIWNRRLDPEMRVADTDVIDKLVEETDGFSFAYLKELFVSSMVQWMAGARKGTIAHLLFEQLVALREQMRSEAAAGKVVTPPLALPDEGEDDE